SSRSPASICPVKSPQDHFLFAFGDARSGIADPHDSSLAISNKAKLNPTVFRRELDGILNEIGDGFEQKVTVPAHCQLGVDLQRQRQTFFFGKRLVQVGHLTQQFRHSDNFKSSKASGVLDLPNSQESRHY